jgi:rSAM/selenodomain-associated transferase 2
MAPQTPCLSIILPTLNEEAWLPAMLRQLQSLRERGAEVLVVDGGSCDATLALCEGLVDQMVQSEPGRARQMIAGAKLASGEIFWFLHADSQLPDSALDAIRGAIAAGNPWGRFDIELSGRRPLFHLIGWMINLRSRVSGICTGDQGLFVKRELYEQVGGFPQLPLMEDVALAKLLRAEAKPAALQQRIVTSSRRWESNGVWRTIFLMWRLRAAYALGADPAVLARAYYGRG